MRPAFPRRRQGGGPLKLLRRLVATMMGGAGLATVPATAAPTERTPLPPVSANATQVVYKVRGGERLTMDIYRPPADRFPGARPCVVLFHGGAFRVGNPNDFRPFSQGLARAGVIGISVEYTLLQRGERRVPREAIEDARSAMRFVVKRANELGCDSTRIAAGGGSAGGYLALITALGTTFDDPADDLSVSPKPKALLLMNPGVDIRGRRARALGEDMVERFSPTRMVDASLPPTIIFHGTADANVPYENVETFRSRALSAGARDVTLVPFPGRGHGFFNDPRNPQDGEAVVAQSVQFLSRLGWITPGR